MASAKYPVLLLGVAGGLAAGWGASRIIYRKGMGSELTSSKPPVATQAQTAPSPSRYSPLPFSVTDPLSPERFGDVSVWVSEASASEVATLWDMLAKETPPDFSMVEILLRRWTALEPEEAIRVANLTGHSGQAWSAWALNDPEKALAAARASRRQRSVEWVVKGIAEQDPDRALALIEKDPALAGFALGSITTQLAKHGRYEQALDIKLYYGITSATDELKLWAKEDPQAALRWCLKHPYDPGAKANRRAIFDSFLTNYPDHQNELRSIIKDPAIQLEFGEQCLVKLLAKDRQSAIDFVWSHSDPKTRHALATSLGIKLVSSDWQLAVDIYRELADSGAPLVAIEACIPVSKNQGTTFREEAASEKLLRALAEANPAKTLEMAEQIASEKNLISITHAVKDTYLLNDQYGFSAWLNQQPPSQEKDQWVSRVISNITRHDDIRECDFPAGVTWTLQIENEKKRNQEMCKALYSWNERQPDTLTTYLSNPKLPESIREAAKQAGIIEP